MLRCMRPFIRLLFVCAFGCACGESEPEFGDPVSSRGLAACVEDGTDGQSHEGQRCATFRAVSGISMGGGAAMRIGLEHPELFDSVVALGAPYIDLETFLLSVAAVSNGGFCSREQLLANLDKIDNKDDPATWCGPVTYEALALEDSQCDGFSGDYNHLYRGVDAGRGGSFNRVGSFEIVQDFGIVYGNPAFYNPNSKYLPPGVDISHHVPLALDAGERRAERDAKRAEICSNPIVQSDFRDGIFNPDGSYPVITYCDGNGPENGVFEPGNHSFPMEVTLAVDYDRDGVRDFGEPTLAQSQELFEDVGTDGLANADEPGFDANSNPDPNGDDYDWLMNPTGTEANLRVDTGEPFMDLGLDNVAGTQDFGEGDGEASINPNVSYAFSRSPRQIVEKMDAKMLDRLHLYADAGIRDFLLSAQITNGFWGSLSTRTDRLARYTDWAHLGMATQDDPDYVPSQADFSEERVGRHVYLRYGNKDVCPGVDETGRGNHVGTAAEVLDRIQTTFAFASARWPQGDFTGLSGPFSARGGPEGSVTDFIQLADFESSALGRKQPYAIVLPPDYYENPGATYPVIYFLHGQGQKAADLAASALILLSAQMTSEDPVKERARKSDWQKMLIVFADGECQPGECHTGTFYIDHQGIQGDGGGHGEAFFELMRHVEATYRTKTPSMVPKDGAGTP